MKRSFIWALVGALFLAGQGEAHACKDLIYPEHLDGKFIEKFQNIAVVRVKKIIRHKAQGGIKAIKVSIPKSVKGDSIFDQSLEIEIDNSAAERAICPLSFEEDRNYLLFFNRENGKYIASNYLNPYRGLGNGTDHSYIEDVQIFYKEKGLMLRKQDVPKEVLELCGRAKAYVADRNEKWFSGDAITKKNKGMPRWQFVAACKVSDDQWQTICLGGGYAVNYYLKDIERKDSDWRITGTKNSLCIPKTKCNAGCEGSKNE